MDTSGRLTLPVYTQGVGRRCKQVGTMQVGTKTLRTQRRLLFSGRALLLGPNKPYVVYMTWRQTLTPMHAGALHTPTIAPR